MSDGLKDCPFCGGDSGIDENFGTFWVECSGCGVVSGTAKSVSEVEDNWNSRAEEDQSEQSSE